MKNKLNKSLLLLGGSFYLLPVIKICKELGVKVYTADFLPDNYAHKYSDGFYNVSVVDKNAVLELAKKLNVDGITSFATDAGVTTMAYVTEKLGLPSVGSFESVNILQNKPKFRAFLRENDFNAPYSKGFRDFETAKKEISHLNLPLMVKPSDSAGSKGVTKLESFDDLEQACAFALQYSIDKEFIIEEYIEKVGCSSDTDCFSVCGSLEFFSTNSQYFDPASPGRYAPCGYIYPSLFPEHVNQELKSELQRLIDLLELKTTIYNVESRISTDGKVYLMEVSPRGGGNRLAEMIKYAYGVDLIKATVLSAVGENVQLENPRVLDSLWVEIVLHSSTSGVFEKIIIDNKIKDYIVELNVHVNKGDKVDAFSAANKTLGTAILNVTDKALFDYVRQNIHKLIQIKVIN